MFRRVRKIVSNGGFIIRYEYVIYLTRERLAPEGFRSVSARSAIRVRFMRHMLQDVFLCFFFGSAQLLFPESREFKNATDAFKYDGFRTSIARFRNRTRPGNDLAEIVEPT